MISVRRARVPGPCRDRESQRRSAAVNQTRANTRDKNKGKRPPFTRVLLWSIRAHLYIRFHLEECRAYLISPLCVLLSVTAANMLPVS